MTTKKSGTSKKKKPVVEKVIEKDGRRIEHTSEAIIETVSVNDYEILFFVDETVNSQNQQKIVEAVCDKMGFRFEPVYGDPIKMQNMHVLHTPCTVISDLHRHGIPIWNCTSVKSEEWLTSEFKRMLVQTHPKSKLRCE